MARLKRMGGEGDMVREGLGRARQGDVWAADLIKTVVCFKMEPLGVSTERT